MVDYQKTSNKAQEFALAGEQEKKKKTFEELVPEYLHDFTDVFADDGERHGGNPGGTAVARAGRLAARV